ncbi:MAG: hypothetical protein LBR23_06955 [Spirochaetaceae bacterium]|jgi:hypothetical protein|nr:hypothetical protein [Spirochaetaceae bacterium]
MDAEKLVLLSGVFRRLSAEGQEKMLRTARALMTAQKTAKESRAPAAMGQAAFAQSAESDFETKAYGDGGVKTIGARA